MQFIFRLVQHKSEPVGEGFNQVNFEQFSYSSLPKSLQSALIMLSLVVVTHLEDAFPFIKELGCLGLLDGLSFNQSVWFNSNLEYQKLLIA